MAEQRSLHLLGALGTPRTEMWDGREHLVVPMVALMEGVIHAVNAKTAEFVGVDALTRSAGKWNGHPIVVGHPVRDGKQISAHDPMVLEKHGCGFIRSSAMNGKRLGMEALIDPARLIALKQDQLLADLRAGKDVSVSVGAFVTTNDKKSSHNGKAYDGEWLEIGPDHTALLPGGVGACSLEMGCGANRAAMRVCGDALELETGDQPQQRLKGASMNVKSLKARILALFDTPEQAASEEAAELIAYQSMRDLFDGVGDQWDAGSKLIDALIADEEENPTVTPGQEDAEEEVETARLDALRMHCYTMISALQSVSNACSEQQMPDSLPVSDPRYMEQWRSLDKDEHGYGSYKRDGADGSTEDFVQSMADKGSALDIWMSPKRQAELHEIVKAGGKVKSISADVRDDDSGKVERWQDRKVAAMKEKGFKLFDEEHNYDSHELIFVNKGGKMKGLIGKSISAKNMGIIQSAHDASHDMHSHTVALGATCNGMKLLAAKDCPTCEGTGQITKDEKQQDCPACDGEGVMKAAATTESGLRAAEEGQMNEVQKAAALKALATCGCDDAKIKALTTDEQIISAMLEQSEKHAAALTAATAKIAELEPKLKAAEAAQLPAEELATLRALGEDRKAKNAADHAALVAQLVPLKTLTKEQLEAKSLDELKTLAAFAKVETVDYSGRGMAVPRSAGTTESYVPPNPYEAGLKALQAKVN